MGEEQYTLMLFKRFADELEQKAETLSERGESEASNVVYDVLQALKLALSPYDHRT